MSLTAVDCWPFSLAFLSKTTETGQLGSSLRTFSQIIKTQYTLCIEDNRSRIATLATSNFLCISISTSEMFYLLLLLWPWWWTWTVLLFWFLSLLLTITIQFFRSSVHNSSDRVGVMGMEGEGDTTSQYFPTCLSLVHFSTPSPRFYLSWRW